jgi:hypothetical protein
MAVVALLAAFGLVAACGGGADAVPQRYASPAVYRNDAGELVRDKYRQPFASDSIWNMPIGSEARYVDAELEWAGHITIDEEYWLVTSTEMPLRPFYTNATFGPGRCATTTYRFDIHIPDDFVVPDADQIHTPNNVAAFLMPDGRTILQMNPIARCEAGGPLTAGWLQEAVDIYGHGIPGAHGGSHLSSVGGSIRLGELTGDEPIRHALKVNLWANRFLSRTDDGYRWPALTADATAVLPTSDPRSYNGPVPELRMGALLAIPTGVDLDDMGLQTEPARKLAWTFQNYGAYVVDATGWDAHALNVEKGVAAEFQDVFGHEIESNSGPWYEDMMRVFEALAVVDNNAPDRVGGGGERLQPLAPPLGN